MPFASIQTLMLQAVEERIFPGAALIFSKAGRILFNEVYGYSDIFTGRTVTHHTLFDLASLTKPLATTLAILSLIQRHRITLEQTVGEIISRFQNTSKSPISIRHLLCHNSGLPAYQPYFMEIRKVRVLDRKNKLRSLLVQEPLSSDIGSTTLYSDIGFMILEWVIETVTGVSLNEYLDRALYRPLEIDNLFYEKTDGGGSQMEFAATEVCPWRKRLLQGEVHDENAFVMGGIAGHAGLFGAIESVHQLLFLLMDIYRGERHHFLLPQALVRLFLTVQEDSGRALGFDTPSETGSSCGDLFTKNKTVGHLGFTGTSFWMDLNRSIIIILLTNRIHPSRQNEKIKQFRPILHNSIMNKLIES